MRTTTVPRTRADRARRRRPPTRGPTTITTAQRTHTRPASAHAGSPVTSRRSASGRALPGAADAVLGDDREPHGRLACTSRHEPTTRLPGHGQGPARGRCDRDAHRDHLRTRRLLVPRVIRPDVRRPGGCGDRGARRRLVVRAGAVLPDCRAADLAVAAAQGSAAVRQGPARKARDPARRVHPPGQPVSRVRLVPRERPWHGGALAVRARAGVAFRPGPDLVPRGAARVLLGLRAVAGLALGCAAARVAAPAGN